MENEHGNREFSAEGAVVEILERGGERFAKILIGEGTVLEVPAASMDITLGDRVIVDASLNIEHVRSRAALPPGATSAAAGGGPPDTPAADQSPSVHDYQHVLRMAALFAVGVGLFVAVRSWLVPHDFGVYGHYRAAAIEDTAMTPSPYAGRAACAACHADGAGRLAGRHAKVGCEACHGPLGDTPRARETRSSAPTGPHDVPALSRTPGRSCRPPSPRSTREHAPEGACTDCHSAHSPSSRRRDGPGPPAFPR